MFLPLMAQLRVGRDTGRPRTCPDAVRGDKAYSSRAIRGNLRSRRIKAVIPEPDDQKVTANAADHAEAARSRSTPPTTGIAT
jgi:hypothetical protein